MARVLAVSKSNSHTFSKYEYDSISLIENEGVEGDAHSGSRVKHRSRVKENPDQANLRQVHLIHNELIEELKVAGYDVKPGTMGENITTEGLELLALPENTVLRFSGGAEVVIKGLRNPCAQLDNYQKGLMGAVLGRDSEGNIVRKAGVMGVVKTGGLIRKNDTIEVILPDLPHRKLDRV